MSNFRQNIALALCFDESGRILVGRRPAGRDFAGMLEFPGGKINPGERPQDAAVRELMEETGLAGRPVGDLEPFDYDYPHARLTFWPVVCRVESSPGSANARGPGRRFRWMRVADLDASAFPPANAELTALLRSRRVTP